MGWVAAAAAVAQTAMSVIGSVQEGRQAVADAKFEQRQYEDAARDELIASAQEEAQRRRELNDTLATIDAMRAGRGLSQQSPTARALRKSATDNAMTDIGIGKTNRLIAADTNRRLGAYGVSQAKSKRSLLMGKAVTSAVTGGSDLYDMYKK